MVIALVLLLALYLLDNFTWNNHFYSGSIKRLYVIRKQGARRFRSERARIYITKGQLDRINGLLQFFEGQKSYLMPLVCAPMINFLTGLENPTRYSILFPSYFAKDPSRQEQVIESVKKYNIRYLLIHGYFWNRHDNLGFNNYAPKVWEFVMKQYRLEKEIGIYLIFSRRG